MSLAKRWNQEGKVIVMSETTDEPLTLIGECAGLCWNADTSDPKKNYKRGLECLRNNHGRALEYAQVYMILDGWSARLMREVYTHVGGAPTRLQASTRYIDYADFEYTMPPAIANNAEAKSIYESTMKNITDATQDLEKLGIKREDSAMLLPLGMNTKVVYRTNLRALIDMAEVRKCTRAYHEYRTLFKAIEDALRIYSDEWKFLIDEEHIFKIKCEKLGYCNERYGCGRAMKQEEFDMFRKMAEYCHKNNIKVDKIYVLPENEVNKILVLPETDKNKIEVVFEEDNK